MTGGACEGGEGEHGAAEPGAEVDPGGQNRWLDINSSILQQNPLIITPFRQFYRCSFSCYVYIVVFCIDTFDTLILNA